MATGTPQHHSHASEQLFEGEWFDEVVVGTDLEAPQSVVDGIASGKEDDGYVSTRAEPPRQLETVSTWQTDIEEDQVRHRCLDHSDVDTISEHRDGEALMCEGSLDTCADRLFVLDDDDTCTVLHMLSIAALC
jgi:hypothetical protein